ncbi:MAG: hypothetical protein ACD_12C00047G0005, partial [uncultured bacterium]
MLDIPEKQIRPPKITNYSMDINQGGPFKPERQVDEMEEEVKTPDQKKQKAKEMGKRLTTIEKQLYNSNTGYGKETE